jgi:hypothetical protein
MMMRGRREVEVRIGGSADIGVEVGIGIDLGGKIESYDEMIGIREGDVDRRPRRSRSPNFRDGRSRRD